MWATHILSYVVDFLKRSKGFGQDRRSFEDTVHYQNDLLRVVSYRLTGPHQACLHKVFGTAFLVGNDGVFITAGHVLRNALDRVDDGLLIGVVGNPGHGNKVAPITDHEFAPNGQDIAIGVSTYTFQSWYRLGLKQYEIMQSVATVGFPEEAFIIVDEEMATPLRAYTGIVQRIIVPGHLALQPKTQGFEISFSPSPGVSGAPLYIRHQNYFEVIGVCAGSFKSEMIDDEITNVSEGGSKYSEKRVRITQFGVAEALRPLTNWKPKVLRGAPLSSLPVA